MLSHIFTATKVRLDYMNIKQNRKDPLTDFLFPKIKSLLSNSLLKIFFFNNFDFSQSMHKL